MSMRSPRPTFSANASATVRPRCRVTRIGRCPSLRLSLQRWMAASPGDVVTWIAVADEEVAFAARLLVRGREAVVLEFPWPESTIQFRANHVLHDRADIPDAERSLLPFL